MEFNLIGDYIAKTINSMSADSLVSLLGLSSKEASVLKKAGASSDPFQKQQIGSYAARKIKTNVPASLWSQINQTIVIKQPDLEDLKMFKAFLQMKGLIAETTTNSLLDMKLGEMNMFHQLRNKMIKSSLKYSLMDAGQAQKYKAPSDAILIMAVAGAPLEYPDFSTYKNELLDSIGVNDGFLASIKDKVSLKEIGTKIVDGIDDDEFLNGIF